LRLGQTRRSRTSLPDGRWFEERAATWRDRRGRPARWPDLMEATRFRKTRVVLAAAHLDSDPTNNRLRNLRALCQRCHMLHDRPHHLAQRWITYRRRSRIERIDTEAEALIRVFGEAAYSEARATVGQRGQHWRSLGIRLINSYVEGTVKGTVKAISASIDKRKASTGALLHASLRMRSGAEECLRKQPDCASNASAVVELAAIALTAGWRGSARTLPCPTFSWRWPHANADRSSQNHAARGSRTWPASRLSRRWGALLSCPDLPRSRDVAFLTRRSSAWSCVRLKASEGHRPEEEAL
jgi:hypothetical protein